MSTHITQLSVPRREDEPGDVLRVVFRPTRSVRDEVAVALDLPLPGKMLTDLAYDFVFEEPPTSDIVTLKVVFEGEPVSLASATWYDKEGWVDAPSPPSSKTWAARRRRALRKEVGLDSENAGAFQPKEIAHFRSLSASHEQGDPLAVAFFSHVDLTTSPLLMDSSEPWYEERLSDVKALMEILIPQLAERHTTLLLAIGSGGQPGVPTESAVPASTVGSVHRIAEVLVSAMTEYYPGQYEGVDIGALGLAYESFATGALGPCKFRSPRLYEAEPDSSYMFCWAEFAFLCQQLSVQPTRLWERLIVVFTCAEMLFVEAYCNRGIGCDRSTAHCSADWVNRGPPVLPQSETPKLQDEHWRQLVRDIHYSPTAHLQLLHAQHLVDGCPGGIV